MSLVDELYSMTYTVRDHKIWNTLLVTAKVSENVKRCHKGALLQKFDHFDLFI